MTGVVIDEASFLTPETVAAALATSSATVARVERTSKRDGEAVHGLRGPSKHGAQQVPSAARQQARKAKRQAERRARRNGRQ